MGEGTRAARLLFVMRLLEQRPQTISELAYACGVSRTTIGRDLITLQISPLCVPLAVERDRWRVLDLKG